MFNVRHGHFIPLYLINFCISQQDSIPTALRRLYNICRVERRKKFLPIFFLSLVGGRQFFMARSSNNRADCQALGGETSPGRFFIMQKVSSCCVCIIYFVRRAMLYYGVMRVRVRHNEEWWYEVNAPTLNQQLMTARGRKIKLPPPPPAIELIAGSLHFPIFLMILYFLMDGEMRRFQRTPLSQIKHSIKNVHTQHLFCSNYRFFLVYQRIFNMFN